MTTANQVIIEDVRVDVDVNEDVPNQITLTASSSQTVLARRHVHNQSVVSNQWTINHALGGYPSVMVVDTAKTVVVGDITYNSESQIVVNFSVAFAGYAYLT